MRLEEKVLASPMTISRKPTGRNRGESEEINEEWRRKRGMGRSDIEGRVRTGASRRHTPQDEEILREAEGGG